MHVKLVCVCLIHAATSPAQQPVIDEPWKIDASRISPARTLSGGVWAEGRGMFRPVRVSHALGACHQKSACPACLERHRVLAKAIHVMQDSVKPQRDLMQASSLEMMPSVSIRNNH